MAVTPKALVAGITRAPLPFGIFSVVPFRENSTDRWEPGVQFETIGCPESFRGFGEHGCVPDDGGEEEMETNPPRDLGDMQGGLDLEEADYFFVEETYECSPIGNPLNHAETVARARLEAWEEMRVEQALSTGDLGQEPNFSQADDLGETDSITESVMELETKLATEYGSQGILHVSIGTAILGITEGLFEVGNRRLRTVLGTPVVAGAGYDFDGIIATPAMMGYRGEIMSNSSAPEQHLDRKQNKLYGVANRQYELAMDSCGSWLSTFKTDTD